MTRRYGDARQICHLVCLHLELLATVCTRARPQNQVEDIFRVHSQTAQLGAMDLGGFGYCARLAPIPVQGQGPKLGSRNVNGVPLQDYRCLRGIPTANNGGCGGALAEGAVDGALQGVKCGGRVRLFSVVAGNRNVDDASRGDVRREEDGGKLDLRQSELRATSYSWVDAGGRLRGDGGLRGAIGSAGTHTRRLSSVRRTATPASTLPTVRETSIVWAAAR